MIFILSLVMGIVLNFTMFLCTIVNSALTTTIVGVLKGVGSTVSLDNLKIVSLFINHFQVLAQQKQKDILENSE